MVSREKETTKTRLVVYTVLLGVKEPLGAPLQLIEDRSATDLELDFICFTDNRDLVSDTWRFIYLEDDHLPPEKLSRRPKTLPSEYLAEWSYSLHIDNIVTFKRLPTSRDLQTTQPYLFKVFLHAFRNNLPQEADAIAMLGYDDVNVLSAQLDYYGSRFALESIRPIHTCTVMLREHHNPLVKRHGVIWWENILCFSKRDQMSFDFAAKASGCHIEAFPGFKHENDFINGIENAGDNRIKADFDEVKYAWTHRDTPEARNNPRAHFLANPNAVGADYAKRSRLFEHICRRNRSSLGETVAPRRGVADALQDLLASRRSDSGELLLVRVRDKDNSLNVSTEEFNLAASALTMLLSSHQASTLDIEAAQLSASTPIAGLAGLFDLVFVFGLPPHAIEHVIDHFMAYLNPIRGALLELVAGEAPLGPLHNAQRRISGRAARQCRLSIGPSRHDDVAGQLANSLICFEWAPSVR